MAGSPCDSTHRVTSTQQRCDSDHTPNNSNNHAAHSYKTNNPNNTNNHAIHSYKTNNPNNTNFPVIQSHRVYSQHSCGRGNFQNTYNNPSSKE